MRYSFALLALALAGCSDNSTSEASRKPAVMPLGSAADRNSMPTAVSAAPAPATVTAPPAKPMQWPAAFEPAAGRICTRVAVRAAIIRTRPGAEAAQFGQLAVGDRVHLAAQTADGWVGFNPGTAQAANVGIFRLRWVRATEAFAAGDSCGKLPLVAAPPATGCLLMAATPVPVRAQPTAGAKVLSTIPAGSYARVAHAKTSAASRWVEVLLPDQHTRGFVTEADVNFNGPCQ